MITMTRLTNHDIDIRENYESDVDELTDLLRFDVPEDMDTDTIVTIRAHVNECIENVAGCLEDRDA